MLYKNIFLWYTNIKYIFDNLKFDKFGGIYVYWKSRGIAGIE